MVESEIKVLTVIIPPENLIFSLKMNKSVFRQHLNHREENLSDGNTNSAEEKSTLKLSRSIFIRP